MAGTGVLCAPGGGGPGGGGAALVRIVVGAVGHAERDDHLRGVEKYAPAVHPALHSLGVQAIGQE
uniref:hypothetical protein n=1 Tax=Nocardia carnea TaxID=37328 RepID=UPI002453BBF2